MDVAQGQSRAVLTHHIRQTSGVNQVLGPLAVVRGRLAVAEPGGYRLKGRWSFASGCDNAQWAICSAVLPARPEGASEPAFFLVPRADYTIDDTWDVIGLAGTGSKTLVLNDVFVPDYRLMTFADAAAARAAGQEGRSCPGQRFSDVQVILPI
jgi:alkylation response protein AidB-like acyl-CoA dehydrogenase